MGRSRKKKKREDKNLGRKGESKKISQRCIMRQLRWAGEVISSCFDRVFPGWLALKITVPDNFLVEGGTG